MSGSIAARTALLFGVTKYVCGGHGARWPADAKFTVPAGITIFFFVPDGDSLSNTIGQKVDQVLTGGTAPTPTETFSVGSPYWDYRLFSSKAGGYLNLAMSSSANPRYITTTNKDTGIPLSKIVADIILKSPNAEIYWSACRSLESGADSFSWDKPTYSTALKGLGGP
ncbi:MAG: hypothetical protein EXR07_17295 [Acetobacteraceae bacterium]|nr:hypothetical protein [Acetobacteraceae bacterium]